VAEEFHAQNAKRIQEFDLNLNTFMQLVVWIGVQSRRSFGPQVRQVISCAVK